MDTCDLLPGFSLTEQRSGLRISALTRTFRTQATDPFASRMIRCPRSSWHSKLVTQKARPRQISGSVKDELKFSFHPRCHLASRNDPCPLRNTYIFQTTDVCPTSQNTRITPSFDCALRGPFSKLLFDPALTFPDSLCAHDYFYLRFIGLID